MRTVLYWAISVTYRILGDTRCTDVSKTDASHRSSPIAIGPAVGSTTHIETIDLALTRSCALLDRLRYVARRSFCDTSEVLNLLLAPELPPATGWYCQNRPFGRRWSIEGEFNRRRLIEGEKGKKKKKRKRKKKKRRRKKKTSFPRAILARGRFFKVTSKEDMFY
ncbi:hypothetical protein GW17_00035912 [Ensete ventricosum]|nr:hypothetical protein GW17_00035912 [Ensete ventricosum]